MQAYVYLKRFYGFGLVCPILFKKAYIFIRETCIGLTMVILFCTLCSKVFLSSDKLVPSWLPVRGFVIHFKTCKFLRCLFANPAPNPKLQHYPLLAVRDCSSQLSASTHILSMRHAVETRTDVQTHIVLKYILLRS